MDDGKWLIDVGRQARHEHILSRCEGKYGGCAVGQEWTEFHIKDVVLPGCRYFVLGPLCPHVISVDAFDATLPLLVLVVMFLSLN